VCSQRAFIDFASAHNFESIWWRNDARQARLALVRQELEAKGEVNPQRLRVSEGTMPVEASGSGRVEFDMVPVAALADGS